MLARPGTTREGRSGNWSGSAPGRVPRWISYPPGRCPADNRCSGNWSGSVPPRVPRWFAYPPGWRDVQGRWTACPPKGQWRMNEPSFYNRPMLSDWLNEIPPGCRGLGREAEYIAYKTAFPNGSWDDFARSRMLFPGTAPLPQRERTREEALALWLAEHDTGDLNAEERQQLSIGIPPRLTPRRFFLRFGPALGMYVAVGGPVWMFLWSGRVGMLIILVGVVGSGVADFVRRRVSS
jgi:hypothetical protein